MENENPITTNRIRFRDQLRELLKKALTDPEDIILTTNEFTIPNLTEEFLTGAAPQGLKDYYQHVVYPLLEERYFHEGETTEDHMFSRIASAIARDEIDEEIFYLMMRLRLFLPATPTLSNAGREHGMLSSCFVIVPEDDMDSISDYWKTMSLVQKHGGGVGVGWDNIRPRGSAVKGTGGIASGFIPFFEVANAINGAIKQGSLRSGANAATMRITHPEIEKFLNFKRDEPHKYMYFNLSATFTDEEFLKCYNNDVLDLYHEKGDMDRQVRGGNLLDTMAINAWRNGDPSPYFIDRANLIWDELVKGRLDPWGNPYGRRLSHNPCGEQNLPDHGACNLGSINFFALTDPFERVVNLELMEHVVRAATRFLDSAIDVNWFPDDRITKQVNHLRNIGLGFMGLADYLYVAEIDYGSQKAYDKAELLTGLMTEWAQSESLAMGEELGCAPVFFRKNCVCYQGIDNLAHRGFIEVTNCPHDQYFYRNSDFTCIAPTGSISLLAMASSGIEPYFSLHMEKLVYPKGTAIESKMLDIIPPALLYFPEKPSPQTAMKLDPKQHVDMLSVVSWNVTNAVSKTVNLPNNYSVEDVKDIYKYAFDKGCKSITIYRDKSRPDQALVNKEDETERIPDAETEEEQIERVKNIKKEPFSMGKLMEQFGDDPIFEEDYEMVQHFTKQAPVDVMRAGILVSYPNSYVGADYGFDTTVISAMEETEDGSYKITNLGTFDNNSSPKAPQCQGCGSYNLIMQEGCVKCSECSWGLCSSS